MSIPSYSTLGFFDNLELRRVESGCCSSGSGIYGVGGCGDGDGGSRIGTGGGSRISTGGGSRIGTGGGSRLSTGGGSRISTGDGGGDGVRGLAPKP